MEIICNMPRGNWVLVLNSLSLCASTRLYWSLRAGLPGIYWSLCSWSARKALHPQQLKPCCWCSSPSLSHLISAGIYYVDGDVFHKSFQPTDIFIPVEVWGNITEHDVLNCPQDYVSWAIIWLWMGKEKWILYLCHNRWCPVRGRIFWC